MVETLVSFPRVRERAPFDAANFNRLMNWLNGQLAAPFALVDDTGVAMVSSNPSIPLIAFYAPVEFIDTVTIAGTIRLLNTLYLYSRNAADSADIGLIRLSASDIIELGPSATQRLTIVSPLTNNTTLNARNAANAANVTLIGLTSADIVNLGQAAQRMTILSSLTNNTGLFGRNAANSADVLLVALTSSDIVNLGAAGNRLSILSPLTNNVAVNARNAANSANVALLLLDASDIIQLGAAGNRLTLQSPLTNNTGVFSRNAANSANVFLIGMNASDQIVTGATGTSNFLMGTVVAPAIDPPTVEGQVTADGQSKAWGYVTGGGGSTPGMTYNTSSVGRNAIGDFTVLLSRSFTGADYSANVTVQDNAQALIARVNGQAAGSFDVHFLDRVTGAHADPDAWSYVCFGTLV